MITVFDALLFLGLAGGAIVGAMRGSDYFGFFGGLLGALIGAVLGILIGRIPLMLAIRSTDRKLASKSTAELVSSLRTIPNCILLELQRRGEDIRQHLPVVVELMTSADVHKRSIGWAALNTAFPELAGKVSDYRIVDSVEECERKTAGLITNDG